MRAVELRSKHDVCDILCSGTPYPIRWLDQDTVTVDGAACGLTIEAFGAPVNVQAPTAAAILTPAGSPTPGN